MGEWLNKVGYRHTMEHNSAMKENELLRHATVWIDLKGNTLCEKSSSPKDDMSYDSIYTTFSK